MEAATVTPWSLVHGHLPGSGRLPGTLRYIVVTKINLIVIKCSDQKFLILVSSPGPDPTQHEERKLGYGELGLNLCACTEEFVYKHQSDLSSGAVTWLAYHRNATSLVYAQRNFQAPIKSQLWHSYMTSLPQKCNSSTATHSYWPIRSQLCKASPCVP